MACRPRLNKTKCPAIVICPRRCTSLFFRIRRQMPPSCVVIKVFAARFYTPLLTRVPTSRLPLVFSVAPWVAQLPNSSLRPSVCWLTSIVPSTSGLGTRRPLLLSKVTATRTGESSTPLLDIPFTSARLPSAGRPRNSHRSLSRPAKRRSWRARRLRKRPYIFRPSFVNSVSTCVRAASTQDG